ncbi:mycofactocin biosynthesis glycosyltransferase MftF [Streptomyces sp. NBC_01762]|uniref:mycofactocin biosynthesis glycosyltransferase MftF n=1 Tax=Streptomyces sp. NBC_01762 TaxID=2975933 RepID=UPI002DDB0CFF|nr:mycofactocin biosynthesis glycosyltransferase MftF [Streptomyces sp. NBC_01762]WSC49313.1 mycofactocin biosynthesis glycosyltransferase MftF [Streptomyces sp. NBC_01762]
MTLHPLSDHAPAPRPGTPPPPPALAPLPTGFRIVLDRNTRVLDGGRTLLGGAPVTRLLRLTPRAQALMDGGRGLRVGNAAGAALADRLLELGLAHPVAADLPLPVQPEATYVVPVRDRPRQLDRLLDSIGPTNTVIVVDDASLDREAVAAVTRRHGARLVSLNENLGPAGARNAGVRLVRTPFVVFVDSDIVLAPDTVGTLLRHFADPRVGLVAPRITGLRTTGSDNWIGRYEQARSSLDLGDRPALVRPGSYVSWASTACVVARVDALGEGFDERMRVGEDVDLGWRAIARGWRLRYEPAAAAAHDHRTRFADWFRRKAEYGTGAQPLAERHPHAIAPAVLAPWSTAAVLALLAQRRWSAPVAAGLCGVTAVRISRRLSGTDRPLLVGAQLTGNGALAALSQTGALITRHWWPATAALCLVSRRARRAAAVAAVADVVLEYRGAGGLDPLRYAAARRLDDLAYGTGIWWSALRGRSAAALIPRIQSPAAKRPKASSNRSARFEPSSRSHSS